MYTWILAVPALFSMTWMLEWFLCRRANRLMAGAHSYPRLPFLGSVLDFIGSHEYLYIKLQQLSALAEEKNKPIKIWLGPFVFIVISDPDDVKSVTNAFVEKPYYYHFGRPWLGHGLVIAPVAEWKRNIKKLAGTFTGSIVDGYQEVFNIQAQKLVDQLRIQVDREPFDIMDHLACTTLESICQTALGVSNVTNGIVTPEYYHAFKRAIELMMERGVKVYYHPDVIYKLTPQYREMMKCVEVLHELSHSVIKCKKIEREKMKIDGTLPKESSVGNGKIQFKAFIDILLELRESDPSFTDSQIRAEVDAIIVGGQETVSSALFYVLLIIGSKVDVQNKMYEEINDIFRGSKRKVTKEDLVEMKYCEAVINETLRLYPPISAVMRYADKDLRLETMTIPKGTVCVINAFGAGRSKQFWGEDALEFKPERWFTDAGGSNASFLAFSYGKRACIGKRYAMAIMKTVLAYCIREYEFTSEADKLRFRLDIVLRPIEGHLIKVNLRKKCLY